MEHVNLDDATRVAAQITNCGGTAIAVKADVSVPDQIESAIQQAIKRFGRLDFIFNNAGIALVSEMRYMDLVRWKRILDINLMGAIYGPHYAYQAISRQGSGHIINIASFGGLVPMPLRSAYATGKFGVVGLTLSLCSEFRKFGVRISVVCPSAVKTPIFRTAEIIGNDRQKTEAALERIRMMDPDRAAGKILHGVARGKGIILPDTLYKSIWRLYRLSPALFEWLADRITTAK